MRMHHAEVLIVKRGADQLTAERSWLRGETDGSFLARRQNWRPPPAWIDIASRIEGILADPDLTNFFRVLDERNKQRGTRFLLAPHLFHIIHAANARQRTIAEMPALGRRPAELRASFKKASAKATALARLVRNGPQPHIALAARRNFWVEIELSQPFPIIQSPNHSETIMPLEWLLKKAAASFDSLADKIPRAQHHRKAAKTHALADKWDLRRLAAGHLVTVFRTNLGHPYHSHVASIAKALTGIPTDADDVKKLDKRSQHSNSSSRGENA